MVHGHTLSEDLRKVIIHMSTALELDISDIVALTKVSHRSIERIINHFRTYGQAAPQRSIELRGRRRALQYGDLAVCVFLFILIEIP